MANSQILPDQWFEALAGTLHCCRLAPAALAASILHFATEAAHMRNLFLGVLSHELRTPLSTIMTSGHSLVLAAHQNKPLPAAADRVLRGSRRIQSLLDNLLDYVRSGLGKGMRVSPKEVDMAVVCERIVAELRANNPGRMIELETLGDPKCVCDEERIAQAISNLVGNALKYGPAHTPVKARIDGSATDQIAVSVQNGGPPIPEATRESLFEPLVWGANTDREGYDLGLGLYIVREIALAHGGTATVKIRCDGRRGLHRTAASHGQRCRIDRFPRFADELRMSGCCSAATSPSCHPS